MRHLLAAVVMGLAVLCTAVPARAAVTVVQAPTASTWTAATGTLTFTWTTAPVQNDRLVVIISWNNTVACSSAGWTALDSITTQANNGQVFQKVAGAGEPTSVTFTCGAGAQTGFAFADGIELSGMDATAPFNAHSIVAQAGATAIMTSQSLTPTVLNTLPIVVFDSGGGGVQTATVPAGWTQDYFDASGPENAIHRTTVTTDTTTAISVAETWSAAGGFSTFSWMALIAPATTIGAIGNGDYPNGAIGNGNYRTGAIGNGSATAP